MTVENWQSFEKPREYIDDNPQTEETSESSGKFAPKTKSAFQISNTSVSRIYVKSSQWQREYLAKHRRERTDEKIQKYVASGLTEKKNLTNSESLGEKSLWIKKRSKSKKIKL